MLRTTNQKTSDLSQKEKKLQHNSKEQALGPFRIQVKLIVVFLIPVCFLILLGFISYSKSSEALISNYKTATVANMSSMSSYIDLGLGMVSDKSTQLSTNSTLKSYYSGLYSNDPLTEQKKFKELQEFVYSNILTDRIINNIYIFGAYGNEIITNGTVSDTLYNDFTNSDEGKIFIDSEEKSQWIGTHSFLDEMTNQGNEDYSISYISYIYNNNSEQVGFIIFDVSIDFITQSLSKSGLPKESKIGFITNDGRELRSDSETNQQYFYGEEYYNDMINNASESNGYNNVTVNQDNYLLFYSNILESNSNLCTLISKNVITEKADEMKTLTLWIVLIASIAAILFGTIISYGISDTIKKINHVLEKSAFGNLTNQIHIKRKDEFLLLGNGINHLIDSIKALIRDMTKVSTTVLNSAQGVSDNSAILLHTTQNISSSVEGVKQGILSQSEGTESCLTQISELSKQIDKVSDNTMSIRQSAENTKIVVKKGISVIDELGLLNKNSTEIVNSVITNIKNLEQKSKAISNIVKGINEIAEQTNLLSFNATIEAARSGKEGKGFNVVAQEIKKLAERSSMEAERIGNISHQIEMQTQITIVNAEEAKKMEDLQEKALDSAIIVFTDIDQNVKRLTDTLDYIRDGIKEIEHSKEDTLEAIEEISAISEQTTAAMDQLSDTAAEQLKAVQAIYHAVEDLGHDSDMLGEKVHIFITE
jgi:methyl-accepting chemotaxis protein